MSNMLKRPNIKFKHQKSNITSKQKGAKQNPGRKKKKKKTGYPFPGFPEHVISKQLEKVAQTVKHLPTKWETRIRSLGWEDLLQKEMATHSSILAWKIPWTKEPGGLQSMGSQRVGHDWATSLSLSLENQSIPSVW